MDPSATGPSGGDGGFTTATTSIVAKSETRGLLCLTLAGNTSKSEVTTAPCDLTSPLQRWLVPKGRFGGHFSGSTIGHIRPAMDPTLCIRGDKAQLEIKLGTAESNSSIMTSVVQLTVVKCQPYQLETNIEMEAIE
jgi:hypothetical protein